ncbi:gamma-glutamylcyclotransferase family protein [Actinomadura rayongensis]|uniref:Putative gamma-glutamylcyclotransferase n=1 Tax=Actinomadura rayongensis TaxID=1429076 RepID=A0A6I4W5W9_9ACTN|nr:gamma-glutamylcyclotransferase family protein [Actinomadura rayongensis]MXQ62544.1 gamma-glutamylcyclotransferase [Actinomadura rayongensis]
MPRSAPRPGPSRSGRPDGLSAEPEALFVYGTLQFPDVLKALIGRVPGLEPAALAGWRAAALPGRIYPGLVSAAGTVHGVLLSGLTLAEWRILDAFEGPEYDRRPVLLLDGRSAWVYVYSLEAEVGDDDWSSAAFVARHLPAYVERCADWRTRRGRC